MKSVPAIIFLITAIAPLSAHAESKVLHSERGWTASVIERGKSKICYLHGDPKISKGKYSRRGDSYIQITFRTREKVRDEVSITAGYTYRKDSEVTVEIDGQKRKLFTDKDVAWSFNAKDDRSLVQAMKSGREMVIKGTSSRGTLTTDHYTLIGFTAAYRATARACGIK